MNFNTLSGIYLQSLEKYNQDRILYQYYSNSELKKIKAHEFHLKVVAFAKALNEFGIKQGDRIGIISENRIEWLISDFACLLSGIIDVPTFPNFTPKQQEYIFENCNAKIIIVSNKLQLEGILSVRENLEYLEKIIVFDEDLKDIDRDIYSFQTILDSKLSESSDFFENKLKEKAKSIKPDDIATIIYTSGTTGNPKGVTLSHGNIVANVEAIIKTEILERDDEFLSFLPMCHAYERTVIYSLFSYGCQVTIAESIDTISTNINQVNPTLMTAVPKLLETVRNKVLNNIEKESDSKKKLIKSAIELGRLNSINELSFLQKIKFKLLDKIVLSKIRDRLGGKLKTMISGGAALQPDVQEFFHSIGITVYQGYGLTETSPVISVNLPDNNEYGTIGKPLFNVEVKIDKNGEILARGPSVMKGYWHDSFSTDSVIDKEGWIHTGDKGEWTEKGNLKITDRIKNIIVSSGGKNIAPAPIENRLRMSKYVEHIMIVGDDKDYLVAVISPDKENILDLAKSLDLQTSNFSQLVSNDKITKAIKLDLDSLQKDLAKYERVRKFVIVENSFTVEGGELTPKMSLKRNIIQTKYSDFIESMY